MGEYWMVRFLINRRRE